MNTHERAMNWANKCVDAYCARKGIDKHDPRYADDIDKVATDALDEFWTDPSPEQ